MNIHRTGVSTAVDLQDDTEGWVGGGDWVSSQTAVLRSVSVKEIDESRKDEQ